MTNSGARHLKSPHRTAKSDGKTPQKTARGIIATVHSRELASRLAGYRVPVVKVSGARLQGVDFPRVASNAQAVVELAVRHLLEKQLPRVAFCGEPHKVFLDFWTHAYVEIATKHGLTPTVYTPAKRISAGAGLEAQSKDRARWLSNLPKPIGIIGWDTITCRHVASACEMGGIEIPEQVAVLSLSTEDLLGRTLHPPLSEVAGVPAAPGKSACQNGRHEKRRPTPGRVFFKVT